MLEHVSDAGAALGVVHRAGIHIGVERNDRGGMAFEDDEVEPVGEGKLGNVLFELFEVLRGQGCSEQQGSQRRDQTDRFHLWTLLANVADWDSGAVALSCLFV